MKEWITVGGCLSAIVVIGVLFEFFITDVGHVYPAPVASVEGAVPPTMTPWEMY